MRKILSLVIGLMSLIAFTSCDDRFIYDDENEFLPIGYIAKSIDTEDIQESGTIPESTIIQILGVEGLIFDEVEKSDWKIITKEQVAFTGNTPLEITQKVIEIENPKEVLRINSNYDDIPVALGNTTVPYQYMGQQISLDPIDDFRLIIRVDELKRIENPFIQYGYINYTLCVGYVPVKYHKHAFMVFEGNENWDWTDEEKDSDSEK